MPRNPYFFSNREIKIRNFACTAKLTCREMQNSPKTRNFHAITYLIGKKFGG